MKKEDFKNLKIYFETRKMKVDKKHFPVSLSRNKEVLPKADVYAVLQMFQEGTFYDFIDGLKKLTSDFDKIIRPEPLVHDLDNIKFVSSWPSPKLHTEVRYSELFTEEFKTDPHFFLEIINGIILRKSGLSRMENFINSGRFSVFETHIDDECEVLKTLVIEIDEYMNKNREIFICDSDPNVFAFDLAVQVHHDIFGLWLKFDFKEGFYHLSKIQ